MFKRPFPLLFAAAFLLAASLVAIVPPQEVMDDIGRHGYSTASLHVGPSLELYPSASLAAAGHPSLADFTARYSDQWEVRWDSRSDRPHLLQGVGIPLLPGRGNDLVAEDLGLSRSSLTVEDVEGLVRAFLASSDVLRVGGFDLRLDLDSSALAGKGQNFWNVELQQFHQGVPVQGAKVYFRISHGNLVQFGADRVSEVELDAAPSIDARAAFEIARHAIGLTAKVREMTDAGSLVILPTLTGGESLGERFAGEAGSGYDHLLAWRFVFFLEGDHSRYQVLVDAKSGEVLEYLDLTYYATVQGDVYPTTNTDPLVTVPFPFATVTNGGTKITDASGNYTYSGGTANVQLNGRYININDNCGAIALANSTTGDLDFGGGGGTDCVNPGFGGAGNTHSARSGYYHLTNINRKAASFLPSNTWLNGTLTANMNINNTCNAFWNGSTVNFYRSGGGCANTGEIAAVFLHEWGHGMDENAGGAPPENGSGEALADTFAFLETKDPCIGDNFLLGSPCYNCNSSCSGVRDISAFAVGGISTIARPDTVESNSGLNCDRYACPYFNFIFPYQGPMGYQGHCESYIASTATWDLAQELVAAHGNPAGWEILDEIWYETLNPSQSAYRVASGGQCNPSASVDGCAASNWYTVFLPADDDDGNLANGTPNGCRIWDAFNAHGIACGSQPACSGGGGGGGGGGGSAVAYGSQTADEQVRTVNLTGFTSPIVAVGPPTFNGGHESVMRVQNVTSSSFQQFLQEWDYLDGNHTNESVGYLVVESGSSTWNGLQVEAGSGSIGTSWTTINYGGSFSSAPVVLTTVASVNDGAAVTTRVRNVTATSFQVKLQEEEAADNVHSNETVHWIALEQGTGTGAETVVVGTSGDSVTHNFSTINFGTSLTGPIFVGGAITADGGNTAAVRMRNLGSSSVEVKIEEEKSADTEVNHTTENVGYVAIGN